MGLRAGAAGEGRSPGGTTAAHGEAAAPSSGAHPKRGAGERKGRPLSWPPPPSTTPRASCTRLPALPAGGERGFRAAVAVARPGAPRKRSPRPRRPLFPPLRPPARPPPPPSRCGRASSLRGGAAATATATAGEWRWTRRGSRRRPGEFPPRPPRLAAAPASAERPARARLPHGAPGGGGGCSGAHRWGPDE